MSDVPVSLEPWPHIEKPPSREEHPIFILSDGRAVTSASDLTTASKCEFAFVHAIDAKRGLATATVEVEDLMLVRSSRLGDEHERRVLERYRRELGNVVEIERPESMDAAALGAAAALTRSAFDGNAELVYQATFFDGSFVGFADFIQRMPDGSYQVQDTKLARTARVTALLQLAAYAEQLETWGVPVAPTVVLILGDGSLSEHRLLDIAPVYRNRRERLLQIVDDRMHATEAVRWGDPRFTVCGHCPACEEQIETSRDVLLVAGMRVTQRNRLVEAGIGTIDDLAESTGPIDGISAGTLENLRIQAALQVMPHDADSPPPYRVSNPSALAALPEPNDGDLFFDFEGDPLYAEAGDRWGLDYLFGFVDARERFTSIWAHTFAEERVALRAFLDDVAERRRQHPGLHIYHYAPYEKTHLLSIAARHGEGEAEVDQLLRENVLIDLYALVKKSVRVGSPSYSIKKLEPLYMSADERRSGDVQNAAASIEEYVRARDEQQFGDRAAGDRMLESIADYNRYDCVSTLRLRDWLLERAREHQVPIGVDSPARPIIELDPSPARDALLAHAGDRDAAARTDDQVAAALAAASIDYFSRERKTFWQEHFSRLIQPIDEWEDTRDVLKIEGVRVVEDWYILAGQRSERRVLELRGTLAPGSAIRVGGMSKPYLLYEYPGPYPATSSDPGARSARTISVLDVFDDGTIVIEETLPADALPHAIMPSALAPAAPPPVGRQESAIAEWAADVSAALDHGEWPHDALVDILRRTPPRTGSGTLAPVAVSSAGESDTVTAAVRSLLDLQQSYLAVQGPPGTGKTYLGAHVIARLVTDHGWHIGVVSQSHNAVDNLLAGVISAGLDRDLVAKPVRDDVDPETLPFTAIARDTQSAFAARHADTGYVIGGTSWDFSNADRFPRRSLDLLVVDEAGQFSLGSTIASSVSARNVLLLGDPQQLPQVSQGAHPEPIDESALGWVAAGHDVLPPELGYFLAASRRMHPAVAEAVSALSYEGQLHAHPNAARRRLDGVKPGLWLVPVDHDGDAVESVDEADAVVALARDLLGHVWHDTDTESGADGQHITHDDTIGRPLTQNDLIVVTPYNAQVATVRERLGAIGLDEIRVGTVDKFQGQEAVISIVTLAASSPAEVPRGMAFLIMKNRLNVAISRAQWAAYLVHSPALVDYLPYRPAEVAELSAFIRLLDGGRELAGTEVEETSAVTT